MPMRGLRIGIFVFEIQLFAAQMASAAFLPAV